MSQGKRLTLSLLIFGVSFGYLEAAVVAYLNALYAPAYKRFYPQAKPGDSFPLLTEKQMQEGGIGRRLLVAEVAREIATLGMLAAVAAAVARTSGEWLAAFAISFGLWDLFYYVFLRVLIHWPSSLWDWDLLFMIPVPWTGPVLAPVVASLSMIGAGFLYLARQWAGQQMPFKFGHWLGFVIAGVILITAFIYDFRNVANGGMPAPFQWRLFALGEAIGFATFGHAFWNGRLGQPGRLCLPESSGSPDPTV